MFRTLLLAAVLLVPLAGAQGEDEACTEAAPCEWVLEIDANGFTWNTVDGPIYNGTVGDWYRFSILNADDVDHTLEWAEYGLGWTVAGPDLLDTQAFELAREGQFFLHDTPTGDDAVINVFLDDVIDQEEGTGAPGVNQPAVGSALVGLGLLCLVAVLRR